MAESRAGHANNAGPAIGVCLGIDFVEQKRRLADQQSRDQQNTT